jgi:hypothetical protein
MIQSTEDLLSQLRPVTGPQLVPRPDEVNWLGIIVGTMIGVLIVVLVFRRLVRIRKPISARDEALAALNQLSNEPTPAAMAALDLISRRWLGQAYRVDGEHETGRSILTQLPQSVREEWSAIFAQLEPGRFSREPLTTTQWSELTNVVRHRILSEGVDISGSVAG